jgi:pimeloyl-ACP methyl ester carboxylesterase
MKATCSGRILLTALLMACCTSAASTSTVTERTPDAYAEPGELVNIAENRRLNLRCEGDGAPTVILEAGANADSTTWFRVQPLIARLTRVCAYDRAGYGFSDEGPKPRTLDADVADLRALIQAADVRTPVVLVGHSLGSNIARRYAQLHPGDVTGLVLVDPPEQNLAAHLPAEWKVQDTAMTAQRDQFLDRCEQGALASSLAAPPPELQACLRAAPLWMSERVAASVAAYKQRPAYWRTLRSELTENAAIFGSTVSPEESHGATPVVVLAAGNADASVPEGIRKGMQAARAATRDAIVASSRQGRLQHIPDSSHDMQLDQPQAIADAVATLLSGAPVRTGE